mgnify:CR=1 FL=1
MSSSTLSAIEALRERIHNGSAKAGIVGLGYVGLPLAAEFLKAGFDVTGIDVQTSKVDALNRGESYIRDVPSSALSSVKLTV